MLRHFENGKIVLVLVATWVIGSVLIFQLGPSTKLEKWPGAIFFDMNTDYTNAEGLAALEAFGENGRQMYWQHIWIDLVFMMLQLVGIASIFLYATSKFNCTRGWVRYLVWLIVVWTLIDIAENVSIASALSAVPETAESHIAQIRTITKIKQIGMLVIPILVLPSLILLVIAAVQSRKRPAQ